MTPAKYTNARAAGSQLPCTAAAGASAAVVAAAAAAAGACGKAGRTGTAAPAATSTVRWKVSTQKGRTNDTITLAVSTIRLSLWRVSRLSSKR